MDYIDLYIIFYLVMFLVILALDYFLILKKKYIEITSPSNKKKKKKEEVKIIEIEYLVGKFKLSKNKILKKWVLLWCALFNAFIITTVAVIVSIVPMSMIWQLMLGFALLIGLIYSLYELFGRYLVKKGLY